MVIGQIASRLTAGLDRYDTALSSGGGKILQSSPGRNRLVVKTNQTDINAVNIAGGRGAPVLPNLLKKLPLH
jgi:hypothetical protein